jgi:transposase
MIAPSPGLRVMVALDPVDFRKGAAGLAALVQTGLGEDAFSRTIYVFRARRADRLKLVFWDGTGLCLFAKTLDAGAFQLAALIEGLDWTRVHAIDARRPRAMV